MLRRLACLPLFVGLVVAGTGPALAEGDYAAADRELNGVFQVLARNLKGAEKKGLVDA